MRVAWLSPTAGNSGIVEYTRQVVPALAHYLDVDLWTHGPPDDPPEGIAVVDYASEAARLGALDGYDLLIYNLGNHLGFHRHELELSRRHPGVVVLHDRTLHHLWAGYFISHLGREDVYHARMTALYGQRGAEVAKAVIAQLGERAWSHPEEVLEHNFIPDTLAGALGAVVHSHSHASQLRRSWIGPVCDLPFPAYAAQLEEPTISPARRDGEPLTLISVGHVDAHKQIHAAIEVLRGDPGLAERLRYLVIGGYDPRSAYIRDLHRSIADAGLAHTVKLLGYQPPGALRRYLRTADAFVNLRLPNLESGSASLMEQMSRGRPILVYDNGSFAELPDDAVIKVPPGDLTALGGSLYRLLEDPRLQERVGAAARRCAESRPVTEYAATLARFAETARRWRVKRVLTDRVGETLAWMGTHDEATARTAGAEIDRLLSRRSRPA